MAEQKAVTEEKIRNLPIIGHKPKSEKEEKYLREMGNFEFINLEEPGLMHTFGYGNTQNNHKFQMFHGQSYRLPRFMAMHVESKGTPIWDWRPDGTGRMTKKMVGQKPRFQMRQVYNG